MTEDKVAQYQSTLKKAWALYALIVAILIVILFVFVAQDNEERFFYTIMPAAAAYVFRPTRRYMGELIYKFTGVSDPEQKE